MIRMREMLVCIVVILPFFFVTGNPARSQGTYEILHDTLSGTGWFGGDNSAGGPRSVGTGQGVRIDSSIILTDFSLYFASRFDYAVNPDGFGHDVTLVLNIRDSSGAILQTMATFVPASFEGGWVTWTDINMDVTGGTFLIFTSYLIGAYDLNQYFSSNGADVFQLYTPGPRYGKDGVSDPDMELWADWVQHPTWDSMFWLQGTIIAVSVEDHPFLPANARLDRNYPNPFNPVTTIEFTLPREAEIDLRIYDILGNEVAVLADGRFRPGLHRTTWDATRFSSGFYLARLRTPYGSQMQKLLLMR